MLLVDQVNQSGAVWLPIRTVEAGVWIEKEVLGYPSHSFDSIR